MNAHTTPTYLDTTCGLATEFLNCNAQDLVSQIELGQRNVSYNVRHTSLLLHFQDKLAQSSPYK
jgi:hypothetical protein